MFSYGNYSLSYFDLNFARKQPFFGHLHCYRPNCRKIGDFRVSHKQVPEVGTPTGDPELILSWIESLYGCLSSPGARYSMCTHQAHQPTQTPRWRPNFGPHFGPFLAVADFSGHISAMRRHIWGCGRVRIRGPI